MLGVFFTEYLMFEPVSNKIDFPAMEEEILCRWEEEGTFEKSLGQRKGKKAYVFYDGPPFATGLPHYGHLLAGTIKDIVPRYHTMRGHYVERRFGWDCHGLPIEALAQDALGLAGSTAIKEAGIDVFNEKCRSMVLTYVQEWRKTVTRMGRWVDFDSDYKTMDPSFMESVWWVFKQLWDQGRVYKDYRIMPYSWKLTTPLSNFEAGNNYKEIQDPAITVRMRMKGDTGMDPEAPLYVIAWTTTPWTLPGNLALCVGAGIDYVVIKELESDDSYLIAEARLETYYKEPDAYRIVRRLKGEEAAGWTYEPLFPYFGDHPNSFRILADDFVTTEDGTGIVHMAPAYGEDDYRVCRREGIELVDYLDEECAFTGEIPEYAGTFCKDADKQIIKRLKNEKKLVHQSTYQHNYPFCERTDTPLIYRAIDAWYVRVEDIRDRMVGHNQTIHWVPDYVGRKRFDNWLREAKDWNISRNRFWGSCLPVWVNEADSDDMLCVGSIEELETLSGEKITDLHKHFVDKIVIERNGNTYRRTPEVLDCWFESGSMPYARNHYPFENKDDFEKSFPADFIAEGLDQTRGWFYTLTVLATTLFDRPAFRNCIVNGMVMAEDGRKMSKRLKNYPDPLYIIDTYGADALRLHLISSPVVRAEDLCFSEESVKHSLRHLLLPWWNAYSFFVLYARTDGWAPAKHAGDASPHLLDRWILSSLETLNDRVVQAMDVYDLQRSVRPFVRFIEDLTNWYIRRSRRRFWKSTDDDDKLYAYSTLYQVLLRLTKIAAPYVPFASDAIYRNLRTDDMPESVHLCDFPEPDGADRDPALEAQMNDVMTVVNMGRVLRAEYKLKVRQPLKSIHIACRDQERVERIRDLADLISDELNLKQVDFGESETELATLSAKADFRKLGPRVGKNMKQVAKEIQKLDAHGCEAVLAGNSIRLVIDGSPFEVAADEISVERTPRKGLAVAAQAELVVALEIELSDELIFEGFAREIVNRVQGLRKAMDLEVTQRIRVTWSTADDELATAIEAFREYIMAETLALELVRDDEATQSVDSLDINGREFRIRIESV
jgi:isoleucyl-tRNA synthetase